MLTMSRGCERGWDPHVVLPIDIGKDDCPVDFMSARRLIDEIDKFK
jgi:hypothetical protein